VNFSIESARAAGSLVSQWPMKVSISASSAASIIVLNPADPPVIIRDTVFCAIPAGADPVAITDSITAMVGEVAEYVPGYTMRTEPQFDDPRPEWNGNGRVAVFLDVRGNGDHLPSWAGNLDIIIIIIIIIIITAAAARVGELLAIAKQAAVRA
jgi:acetaldehyde dehydrogenase